MSAIKRLLAVVALVLLCSGQEYNEQFNRRVAVCADSDDFSTDLLATCWTMNANANWAVTGGQLVAGTNDVGYYNITHNNEHAADQWVCWQFLDFTDDLVGPFLRSDGAGGGYSLRIDAGTDVRWMYTSNWCDTFTLIETDTYAGVAAGDYVCVSVVGADTSTVLTYWDCDATPPGSDPGNFDVICGAGVTMLSDPGVAYNDAGEVGVCSPGVTDDDEYDNFQAGDL